jgi:hypothetical protein
MDDDAIRTLVTRLGRAHPSGGLVVERAAVLSQGEGSEDVIAWILAHGGKPEAVAPKTAKGGLFGSRFDGGGDAAPVAPSRFVLPADALG